MKIAVASDHAGFIMKQGIVAHLVESDVEHKDFGCGPGETVDYVDYGARAAEAVSIGQFDRAILVCGTGMGMSMVANKFKGVRATACWSEYTAEMSRRHNDSNCLTLGGRVIALPEALKILRVWLKTEFDGGRHQRRLDKLKAIEEHNFVY
jgi:ribose 5-phosphate isomerase B